MGIVYDADRRTARPELHTLGRAHEIWAGPEGAEGHCVENAEEPETAVPGHIRTDTEVAGEDTSRTGFLYPDSRGCAARNGAEDRGQLNSYSEGQVPTVPDGHPEELRTPA